MINQKPNAPWHHRRTTNLNKAWKQLGGWAKAMDAQPLEGIACRLRRIEAKLAMLEDSQSVAEATTARPPTLE